MPIFFRDFPAFPSSKMFDTFTRQLRTASPKAMITSSSPRTSGRLIIYCGYSNKTWNWITQMVDLSNDHVA